METTELIKNQLIETYHNLVGDLIGATPKVISGVILILVALIVAKIIEKIVRVLLVRTRFDSLLGRVGIDTTLQQLGLRQSLSEVAPRVVYFLLLFLFARSLAETLGLTAVSGAIGTFLGYVPNIVAALIILLVGSALGRFAGAAITRSAEGSGLEFGQSLGSAVSGAVLFVAAIMAITQLRIDTDIVRLVTACSLAGLALAFGLSFGLSSRSVVGNILAGFYVKKHFGPGTVVEVQGQRGTVAAVSSTSTFLDVEDHSIVLANDTMLSETATVLRTQPS